MKLVRDYFTKGMRRPNKFDIVAIVSGVFILGLLTYCLVVLTQEVLDASMLESVELVLSIEVISAVITWRRNPLFDDNMREK